MRLTDFLERGAAVRGLREAFLAGAPPHAALLTGPAGVVKRTLSALLANSLHCAGGEKPCGVCPPCRRFLSGSHPDAHHLKEQKRIGVDAVRGLTASLSAAAYEGGWRTARIDCAGAMTSQAQNSLLKTLEEPPPRTVFLLTAVSASQLLPTVRSRCSAVPVPPLTNDKVEQALTARGVDPARAAELSRLSGGSVGLALSLHEDDGFWALRGRVYGAMEGIRRSSDAVEALFALKDEKEDAGRVCDLLEHALRGALLQKLSGRADGAGEGFSRALLRADARSLVALLEKVSLMRRMLSSNVPWQAALERFVLDYAEESIRWQQ